MEIKYLKDGRAVDVIQKLIKGYLVSEVYIVNGEAETDSSLMIADEVYDEAPNIMYDERIAALRKTLSELHEEKSQLIQEIYDRKQKERAEEKRFEKYKKYSQLQLLDDYLEGRITHVVVKGYNGINILTIDQIKADNKYDSGFKLITLYGQTDGDLQWRINQYSDGSGSSQDVILCTSYEQALSAASEFLIKLFAETIKNPRGSIIKNAEALGVPIPENYQIVYNQAAIKKLSNDIKEYEKEIKDAQDKMSRINKTIKIELEED
jgi:hypothetical protein